MISIDGSILIFKEHPNKGIGHNSQVVSEPIADRKDFLSPGVGGADRARTGDLLVANQVLSQLSYSPSLVLAADACYEPAFNAIVRKSGGSGKI